MTIEGGCGPTFEMPPGLGNSFEVWSVLSCTREMASHAMETRADPKRSPKLSDDRVLHSCFGRKWPSDR